MLGVHWDSDYDQFYVHLGSVIEFARNLHPTKRSVLKIAAKVYDPLGCLSVYTINMKLLFQELCAKKVGWDEELQGQFRREYQRLIFELKGLHDISIPRCVFV